MEKKYQLLLKNMPDDVKEFLLKKQGDIKVEKKISQYSLEQTIYKIIRDYKEKI